MLWEKFVTWLWPISQRNTMHVRTVIFLRKTKWPKSEKNTKRLNFSFMAIRKET